MSTDETKCVWYTSCDHAFVFDEGKPASESSTILRVIVRGRKISTNFEISE